MTAAGHGEELRTKQPWSCEAEQAVLGGLMIDADAFDRVSDVVSEASFWHAPHRKVWASIASLKLANKPADMLTVHEALRLSGDAEKCGGMAYLNACCDSVASAASVRRYAEIVAEHAADRALWEAADKAVAVAHGKGQLAEKLDRIASLFAPIQSSRIRKAPRSIAAIAAERMDYYEALERGDVQPGWPTHINRLNDLLNGGLRPGSLVILAARPKVGKSSFALALAETMAAQKLPTLVLSQEMPDAEVADRAVVHAGRVDYSQLMRGELDADGWSRAADGLERLSHLPMYVDDQPALTITEVRAKARMVKGLKVLVVDYLQLCSGANEDDNRNSQIEGITRGLKALAKSDSMCVVALSQLNRKVDERANKRPQLSDLRDSGAIEQDADVVIFFWPVRKREGGAVVGIEVSANRQGRTGAFALDFDGEHQRWAESTASLDPPTSTEKYGRRSKGFDDED